ncbi:MAG: hypothetical protein OEY94_08735 [Alphaproteobacteria bacterium]|nr:hypothetical protein [Alphaproteobacteria bacterium]
MTDKTPEPSVEEKTEYDNFLDQMSDSDNQDTGLGDLFGIDQREEWEKQWQGMPEFEQEENAPYKKIVVSFKTKEDYEEFAKLIGQPLTTKTKSIWHPRLKITNIAAMRWIVENNEEE